MRIELWGDSLTEGSLGVSYADMLRRRCPRVDWVNLGRGGDTLSSLLGRLHHASSGQADAAFVWIGINEIFQRLSWHYPLLAFTRGQARGTNAYAQQNTFAAILDALDRRASNIFIGLPHLFGEQLDSHWNDAVRALNRSLEEPARLHGNHTVIDLHALFAAALQGKTASDYLPRSVGQIGLDIARLRSDEDVDRASAGRGLHLTLDGVHLNSAGARIVAEALENALLDAGLIPEV